MTDNKSITIKECLDNDVCYGHLTKRWNPKMKDYILCKKNDIHIIDARKTVRQLNIACEKISNIISKGGNILFVCTKKQFSNYIQEVAESTKMPYVTNKWPCGLLTNYNTTLKTIKNINDIGEKLDSGVFKKKSKKDQENVIRHFKKSKEILSGVLKMNSTPKVIFIIDVKREINAVMEAFERGIPTVGIVDTNCDPTNISYPIPGNDDSILSIKLIVEKIKYAVEEGLDKREKSDNTTNLATKKEIKTNENKKNINTFKNKNKKNYERK